MFPPDSPRVIIEAVEPQVDCARYPIKRVVGEKVVVFADIYKEGHDKLAAQVKYRRQGEWLSEDAARIFRGYSGPRNVRQLENAMISALASCESGGRTVIEEADLPREILAPSEETPVTGATEIPDPVWDRLRAEERTLVWHWPQIAPALRDSRSRNGKINWAEAGRLLNRWRVPVSPVQLQRKLKPRLARLCRFSSMEEVLSMSSLDLAKAFLNVRRDR